MEISTIYIIDNPETRRPYIFYNTWNYQERNCYFRGKAFLDSMNLEHILDEIDVAHRLGIDVFVIDTGWFTKTGDWHVDRRRFPDGLKMVKERLDAYGMKLGLWLNPTLAAESSEIFLAHPEYAMTMDGERHYQSSVWETEGSYEMCLVSGYADYFIKTMIRLYKELGVTYFKWDGVGQYGCNSPHHNHGTAKNSPQERHECFSYQIGLEMIRILKEVTRACPGIIVDFDVTEGGRFFGLGFLAVGKYFLINNGPYAKDFDLPEKMEPATNKVAANLWPYTNIFFFPGPARSRICRHGLKFDSFVPSVLFMTHYLPDPPQSSQHNSLASLMLGGNGIWGDLLSLSEEDIKFFSETLGKYKKVAEYVTRSYPKVKGFIGGSPEIYEKIDHQEAKGLVCFFASKAGKYDYLTGRINLDKFSRVEGADHYEVTGDGRLKITVTCVFR